MTFPVGSISTITRRCKRFSLSVLQRTPAAAVIERGGVFNCRQTAGTEKWSPHAFGDAVDLFPKHPGDDEELRRIGTAAVRQATRRTVANRGRRCPIVHVIFLDTEWVEGIGFRHYAGVPHTTHVHVGFSFSTVIKPPCA